MFQQQLRKLGDSFAVTIPDEVVERLGLTEGQLLGIQITLQETDPALTPELAAAIDETWAWNEAGLRYLAEH